MRFQTLVALVALALTAVVPAPAREPVRARHAMVVAQEPLAADVGAAVLKSGGSAVDAAVATAFALAVTHPFAGNIGGGGFALIRLADGRATFIDFREAAQGAASHDMYLGASGHPTKDSLVAARRGGRAGTLYAGWSWRIRNTAASRQGRAGAAGHRASRQRF